MSRSLALAVSLSALLALGRSAASEPTADEAARLLQAAAATYAALHSYRDVGVVTNPDFGDLTFDTAFERPDRFRFGYTEGHPFILLRFVRTTRILRSDGQQVTTWTKVAGRDPTERVDNSLPLGVAGMTGVSRGAAHRIATILMPHLWDAEPFGSSIFALTAPRLLADEVIDEVNCRHVAGTTPKGGHLELWIGATDHLVRRIDSDLHGGGTDGRGTETELLHEIKVNGPVPAALFGTSHARGQRADQQAWR